jgi:hypothetical protein
MLEVGDEMAPKRLALPEIRAIAREFCKDALEERRSSDPESTKRLMLDAYCPETLIGKLFIAPRRPGRGNDDHIIRNSSTESGGFYSHLAEVGNKPEASLASSVVMLA